jgi:GTP-binding protein YchF
MSLEIGIVGLPKSGKTTIFNALTKGKADISSYSSATVNPNIGVSKVPEPRLPVLEKIFNPRKIVPTEIKYFDLAGTAKSFDKDEVISSQLNNLCNADALLQVVRAFENEEVPHIEGNIDPGKDITSIDLELICFDLSIICKRLIRIQDSIKAAKPAEREQQSKEQELLQKIKTGLENEIPVRRHSLTNEELKSLSNYQFLTAKPLMILINIGEDQLEQAEVLETRLSTVCFDSQTEVTALCGKLEMELAQLNDTEADEFRKDMGLASSATDRVIAISYRLLGLISFFTTVSAELKVWTIPKGTIALKAAGKIHTDIEKGFIRAEVISFNDLVKCGNLAEARKQGLLRLEGKNYTVQDGDIITFLFNI